MSRRFPLLLSAVLLSLLLPVPASAAPVPSRDRAGNLARVQDVVVHAESARSATRTTARVTGPAPRGAA